MFLKSVGSLFNDFLKPFQTEKSMIHTLYASINEVIGKNYRRFIKSDGLDSYDGYFAMIDPSKLENH